MKLFILVLALFCTTTLMAQGQAYTIHVEESKKSFRADPNLNSIPDFEKRLDKIVDIEMYFIINKDSFELIGSDGGARVDKGSLESSKDLWKKQGEYYNVIGFVFEKNNDAKVAARIEELRLEAAKKD